MCPCIINTDRFGSVLIKNKSKRFEEVWEKRKKETNKQTNKETNKQKRKKERKKEGRKEAFHDARTILDVVHKKGKDTNFIISRLA